MTLNKLKGISIALVLFVCLACNTQTKQNIASGNTSLKLVKTIDDLPLTMPLSITFTDSLEIVTGDIFSYRKLNSDEEWQISPADSTGTHAIAWKKDEAGKSIYYAVGTNKHQLLKFSSIAEKPEVIGQETIPELFRPHDILYNSADDYFYFINSDYTSDNKFLFRFKSFETGFEKLDLSSLFYRKEYAYARALSLVDGKIYIVVSSYGEVIRLNDFSNGAFTSYRRSASRESACAGSYTTTGLVLNDLEYYNGYWYATNYFSSAYAEGTNYNEYRFIRWKSWDDFTNNRFEDLSDLIDNNMVSYFLTIKNDCLYLAAFTDEGVSEKEGRVYVFQQKDKVWYN